MTPADRTRLEEIRQGFGPTKISSAIRTVGNIKFLLDLVDSLSAKVEELRAEVKRLTPPTMADAHAAWVKHVREVAVAEGRPDPFAARGAFQEEGQG